MSGWTDIVDSHLRVVRASRTAIAAGVESAVRAVVEALGAGNTILVAGNGGSAADAQHFATELVGRFLRNRAALPAIALTTDSSVLTAVGNDLGFDVIFSRQVEALGKAGDVLVAISTSGRSPNVIRAAEVARTHGLKVIAMTGENPGALIDHADVRIVVPSDEVPRIQEVHELVLHTIAAEAEATLE